MMNDKGVLSAADFEQAEVAFQSAEADLEAAQQGVESAGFNIRSTEAAVTEAAREKAARLPPRCKMAR